MIEYIFESTNKLYGTHFVPIIICNIIYDSLY